MYQKMRNYEKFLGQRAYGAIFSKKVKYVLRPATLSTTELQFLAPAALYSIDLHLGAPAALSATVLHLGTPSAFYATSCTFCATIGSFEKTI